MLMRSFNIKPLSKEWALRLKDKIDHLGKPLGALGYLEELAVQLGQIQETLTPRLCYPHNIIFCADHGIVEEGISKSPKEVTWQVVYNMLSGGAGVCYLARQHGVALRIVDVGVDYDFTDAPHLINKKIRYGTRSYLCQAAVTEDELKQAIEVGVGEVDAAIKSGCNIISFGEMGITNTAASSLWMSLLADFPLEECVGRGSGLDDEGIRHKLDVLTRARNRFLTLFPTSYTAEDVLLHFGSYEMLAAVGGMLRAAECRLPIIIDGFIMTACLLAASRLNPHVLEYAIYGHQGDEAGHAKLLRYMNAKPLLHLGLRLGEGSGAVCAYPIVQSAALMLSEMASFTTSGVTDYVADDRDGSK